MKNHREDPRFNLGYPEQYSTVNTDQHGKSNRGTEERSVSFFLICETWSDIQGDHRVSIY